MTNSRTISNWLKNFSAVSSPNTNSAKVESEVEVQPKIDINKALPTDMLYLIFQYLTPTELAIASIVCQSWYLLATNDLLWQSHINHIFPAVPLQQKAKRFYREEVYPTYLAQKVKSKIKQTLLEVSTQPNNQNNDRDLIVLLISTHSNSDKAAFFRFCPQNAWGFRNIKRSDSFGWRFHVTDNGNLDPASPDIYFNVIFSINTLADFILLFPSDANELTSLSETITTHAFMVRKIETICLGVNGIDNTAIIAKSKELNIHYFEIPFSLSCDNEENIKKNIESVLLEIAYLKTLQLKSQMGTVATLFSPPIATPIDSASTNNVPNNYCSLS